jgi:hypothetical protein
VERAFKLSYTDSHRLRNIVEGAGGLFELTVAQDLRLGELDQATVVKQKEVQQRE